MIGERLQAHGVIWIAPFDPPANDGQFDFQGWLEVKIKAACLRNLGGKEIRFGRCRGFFHKKSMMDMFVSRMNMPITLKTSRN